VFGRLGLWAFAGRNVFRDAKRDLFEIDVRREISRFVNGSWVLMIIEGDNFTL